MKITKLEIIAEFKAQTVRPGSEAMVAKALSILESKPESFYAPAIADAPTAYGAMKFAVRSIASELK